MFNRKSQFGPWSTAIDSGGIIELSAFWKARMSQLGPISRGRGGIGPFSFVALLLGALVVVAVPTFQVRIVLAQPETPTPGPTVSGAKQVPVVHEPNKVQPAAARDEPRRREEIERAVQYLLRSQHSDGTWGDASLFPVGMSGLGLLALSAAGLPVDEPHMARGLTFLRKQQPSATYEIALQTLALCATGAKEDARLIQRNVDLMENSRIKNGPARGGWSYNANVRSVDGSGDNSNSEFAVWALDAATRSGAKVSLQMWKDVARYWKEHQDEDGGWHYSGPVARGPGTGSMTCSGIASMAICLAHLKAAGVEPDETDQAVVDRGVQWLAKNFSADKNPGDSRWFFYYAMVLRRAAELVKRDKFGDHDWRAAITEKLLMHQSAETGGWKGIDGNNTPDETPMALFFLAEISE